MRYAGKLKWSLTIGVSTLLLASILLTGCDVSGAAVTLDGPESVAKSGTAAYTVTTTGLTPGGVVEYTPYIRLNENGVIDDAELIVGGYYIAVIDQDGVATKGFSLQPSKFFGDRNLSVPAKTTVRVRADVYWVDRESTLTFIDTATKDLAITNH